MRFRRRVEIPEDDFFGTAEGYEALRERATAAGPVSPRAILADDELEVLARAVELLDELAVSRISEQQTALFEAHIQETHEPAYELLDFAFQCGQLAGALNAAKSAIENVAELSQEGQA